MTYVEFFHRMLLALLINVPIYMQRDILSSHSTGHNDDPDTHLLHGTYSRD